MSKSKSQQIGLEKRAASTVGSGARGIDEMQGMRDTWHGMIACAMSFVSSQVGFECLTLY